MSHEREKKATAEMLDWVESLGLTEKVRYP